VTSTPSMPCHRASADPRIVDRWALNLVRELRQHDFQVEMRVRRGKTELHIWTGWSRKFSVSSWSTWTGSWSATVFGKPLPPC
ncbi:MAG: hypothetical protein JXA21_08015, partial [Anaerolineae bacterium]|nr:hypothetical protein [Anaerolineae bacterium]